MSERYRFYGTPGAKVICVSSYAGRKIRRVATCAEEDEYDYEKGCALAKARVDVEIAHRRLRNAYSKLDEATEALHAAERRVCQMECYVDDALEACEDAEADLNELLDSF